MRIPRSPARENRIEHLHQGALDDLVLQCSNAERALAPIRLGDVLAPRWQPVIAAPADAPMQINQLRFQVLLIVLPGDTVYLRGGTALEPVIRLPQEIDRHMAQQRREPLRLAASCCLPYTLQPSRGDCPAQRPASRVILPCSPWSPPFAPSTPRPVTRVCSPTSSLQWSSLTSPHRASLASAPRTWPTGRTPRHPCPSSCSTSP